MKTLTIKVILLIRTLYYKMLLCTIWKEITFQKFIYDSVWRTCCNHLLFTGCLPYSSCPYNYVVIMLAVTVPSDSLHWSKYEPCKILWPSHDHMVLGKPLGNLFFLYILLSITFCIYARIKPLDSTSKMKWHFTS